MKFSQLPMGARFEYEGAVFVKTSPIAASGETGAQKMIPRYAMLKPLDGTPKSESRKTRGLDEAKVMVAFDAFGADCARLLDIAAADTTQRAMLRAELEAARQRFLEQLS